MRTNVLKACLLACAMLAATMAQDAHPSSTNQIGDMTLHDFAAKWMMQQDDLADVKRYSAENQALIDSTDTRPRIVLMGDSLTFRWHPADRSAPAALNLINRGIPGQNTSQMLLRFESDVVALKPEAVVILAGTNDLRVYAGDISAATPVIVDRIVRNITAMADIAEGRRIKVILCAIPPIGPDHERLARDPAAIVKANTALDAFAQTRGYPFADFYTALAETDRSMPAALAPDGLHPNAEGYQRMWITLEAALARLNIAAK